MWLNGLVMWCFGCIGEENCKDSCEYLFVYWCCIYLLWTFECICDKKTNLQNIFYLMINIFSLFIIGILTTMLLESWKWNLYKINILLFWKNACKGGENCETSVFLRGNLVLFKFSFFILANHFNLLASSIDLQK